jgi:hypothetical protein
VKASTGGFLLLLCSPFALSASQRHVTLKVLSSYQQTVRGVGVGAADSGQSTTTPCSQPFPADVNVIVTPAAGSVSQCTFIPSAGSPTGSVQATNVKAILTTADGSSYFVYLYCQKQYGTCAPLNANETYPAKLSEGAEQLADYSHRRVSTPVKVSLRPDGKNKVTYSIFLPTKTTSRP